MISSHKRGEVLILQSMEDLSTSLADYIAQLSEAAVKARDTFTVVLSGGTLVQTMGKLCGPPYLETIDWAKWHVFWVDERLAARSHKLSCYNLAKDGLLSKVPILPSQVHSFDDASSAEVAANEYEFQLRELVKTGVINVSKDFNYPRFDLILLGMGPDGHIASLFPGHPLTLQQDKWVTFITDSPKPPPERVTFTFPVINSAANVAMVVDGGEMAEVVEKAFGEDLPSSVLPVQMVSPVDGKVVWFLDKDAASKIPCLDD